MSTSPTARRMPASAEYGTPLFAENKSAKTIISTGKNSSGVPCELYHMTAGYYPAGSAAVWTNEIVGVRFYNSDGTTSGRRFHWDAEGITEALEMWERVSGIRVNPDSAVKFFAERNTE